MQLKAILSALIAVLASIAVIAAAPVADTNNENLNDTASKIIVVPISGYPRPRLPFYTGGRDPTIIVIHPSGPYGPYSSALTRRPGKRADNDNKAPKILLPPKLAYPTINPIGLIRPFPRSTEDVDENSNVLLIKPGAGPRPRHPPILYPGYPSSTFQGYSIVGQAPPYPKRADFDAVADANAVENEKENEYVNYSKIHPPNPYWDPRRPHIMS